MGQIVAEELGIAFDRVHIVQPDTDVTPYDTITAGSRSTYHMGNAVRMAAVKIKAELLEVVAQLSWRSIRMIWLLVMDGSSCAVWQTAG